MKTKTAAFNQPDWLVVTDLASEIPAEYRLAVDSEFDSLGKVVNPSTFKIARYGVFNMPERTVLDGIIYQYSHRYNPRNIK